MKIEIICAGCPRCVETERRVRTVLTEAGLSVELVHLTDPREMARRDVILTPAVVIDGVLKLAGRVPTDSEVRHWLRT